MSRHDIGDDGRLRLGPDPASPAVRLVFDTADGPRVLATQRYRWT